MSDPIKDTHFEDSLRLVATQSQLDAARQSGVREGLERAAKLVCGLCGGQYADTFSATAVPLNPGSDIWNHPRLDGGLATCCVASNILAALAEEGRPHE